MSIMNSFVNDGFQDSSFPRTGHSGSSSSRSVLLRQGPALLRLRAASPAAWTPVVLGVGSPGLFLIPEFVRTFNMDEYFGLDKSHPDNARFFADTSEVPNRVLVQSRQSLFLHQGTVSLRLQLIFIFICEARQCPSSISYYIYM